MARYCEVCGKKLKSRDRKIKQTHLSQCRKCLRRSEELYATK